MKRNLILLSILCLTLISNSQDLIVLRSGDSLKCKITRTDSLSIYYTIQKNDRNFESFIEKNEIRNYQLRTPSNSDLSHIDSNIGSENTKIVVLDTTAYVKSYSKWINLITYSQKFGINANGWTLQYLGYILKNDSKWIVPVLFGLEKFTINSDFIAQHKINSLRINYYMAGISPLRKLSECFYANIGFQLLIGTEEINDIATAIIQSTIFGIAPIQGIMFIPKSKYGITVGFGFYEKFLTSQIYKNDIGLKIDLGLKF